MTVDLPPDRWRTSTRTAQNGNCVEIGDGAELIAIRDTKDREGGTLVVSRVAFDSFLSSVKSARQS
ncbi:MULTISPECIES: DUF397 domain-containing protein [Actinoalloteichus]|uniref:DUF397 family protein n=1 Tax=Actinoalloteichus fjordicus TaxID=1612552 RepID=A0AAC9LFW6_9PSEU|nr:MULTISPECIES: DUF397 domain-containing protein [Actinoalloteichus]APU15580.1 putative DUF397 family protein [Actinoalloteichus fjordicus]APU21643.1 putative DUF397 family protein [Actinoalloteichus sp. GBA129-24]